MVALALVHGFACVTHNGNQVVSGMAINILVAGLAPTLAYAWFQQGGQTPLLPSAARLPAVDLPGMDALAGVPVLGPALQMVWRELIDGNNILIWVTLALVVTTQWVLYRSRFGLRLRAVGENTGGGRHPPACRWQSCAIRRCW